MPKANLPNQTRAEVHALIGPLIKDLDLPSERVDHFILKCERLAGAILSEPALNRPAYEDSADRVAATRKLVQQALDQSIVLSKSIADLRAIGPDRSMADLYELHYLLEILRDHTDIGRHYLESLQRSATTMLSNPVYPNGVRPGKPLDRWIESITESIYRSYIYCFDREPPSTGTSGFYFCLEWLLDLAGESVGTDHIKNWKKRRDRDGNKVGYWVKPHARFGDEEQKA